MEINQLRYLLTVAERGSFSKAALHCYISQSALSEQIQKLEDEVGTTLLNRSRRIIVPTEAGRIFISHAKQVMTELARARQEIMGLDDNNSGKVALGILPTIAPYLLPQILESFTVRCSEIEVNIHEDMTGHLLQLIEAGQADLGIMCSPIKESGFEIEELFSEELVVALPTGHQLAKKSSLQLKDLHSEQFILMQDGHCLGDQVLNFFHRHDFRPHISVRSGQLATIQSLIGVGLGISLIPRMATACTKERICYRPLESLRPRRTIAIIWRSRRPVKKAAQEFLNHLRQVGKKFKSPGTSNQSVQILDRPRA